MWSRFFRIRKIYIFNEHSLNQRLKTITTKTNKNGSECAKIVAKETMTDAAKDICQSSLIIGDTAVSVDSIYTLQDCSTMNRNIWCNCE